MNWTPLDTDIVLVGILSGVACALLGSFLVLKRMSLMGDAISHAVLPGLAIAFLVTGSRDSLPMFVGAVVAGLLTALLTQWIHRTGKVEESAAMGVVFTLLFAVGLVLIVQAADVVDLDPGCVLYGALELTPLDRVEFLGIDMPRATRNLLIVCGLNLVFVVAMFKELKITSFDGDLATTLGISANLMHYLLMAMVAVTTVACFESVGSILVLAMLIVPPATAYLLTDRLHVMVILGVVMAAVSAAFGHLAAITIPPLAGYPSTTTSGMMATIAGLLLVVALLAGPRHGLINNMLHRSKLRFDILREDILALVYRLEESPKQPSQQNVSDLIRRALGIGRISAGYALASLQRRGHLVQENHGYHLTPSGETIARHLIRSHRLWERFLQTELQLPADRLHAPAMELEHVTDASMREALAKTAGQADTDPHGKPIPQEEKAD